MKGQPVKVLGASFSGLKKKKDWLKSIMKELPDVSLVLPVCLHSVKLTSSRVWGAFPIPRELRREKGVFGFVCKWPPLFNYSPGWKRDLYRTVTSTCHCLTSVLNRPAVLPLILLPRTCTHNKRIHIHWFLLPPISHVIAMWEITLHHKALILCVMWLKASFCLQFSV